MRDIFKTMLPLYRSMVKRAIDIIIASAFILLLMPLMLAIALILAIDHHGNPLFTQWRTGLDGRMFRMFKFRTMSASLQESEEPVYVSPDEERVTPVGRWLRQTGLDELPQLFNV